MNEPKIRLDQSLVERGLVPSRSRARDLVLRGRVRVEGQVCDKPAREIGRGANVAVDGLAHTYVSRGAEKLIAALDHFGFDPSGRIAIDVGASTGGFSQVLLERGVAKVYAVDSGSAQLHQSLRNDPRLISLENTDARKLDLGLVEGEVSAIVADVSFVSVMKVLGPALGLARPGSWLIVLVKPQFEVGREFVGKGGIVRNAAQRDAAVVNVAAWCNAQPGWHTVGTMDSPILGGSGNAEFLIGAYRDV